MDHYGCGNVEDVDRSNSRISLSEVLLKILPQRASHFKNSAVLCTVHFDGFDEKPSFFPVTERVLPIRRVVKSIFDDTPPLSADSDEQMTHSNASRINQEYDISLSQVLSQIFSWRLGRVSKPVYSFPKHLADEAYGVQMAR